MNHRGIGWRRTAAVMIACVSVLGTTLLGPGVAGAGPGPTPSATSSPTPGLGPVGTSLMHGDLHATDSTPFAGPGRSARVAASSVPGGACAATFIGSDGMVVSLCTRFVGASPPSVAVPSVVLFDPRSAAPLASLELAKGGLLGGVYGLSLIHI